MNAGDWISVVINIAVGAYFAYYYPRHVERRFAGRRLPPLFKGLKAVLRPLGILLIAGSLIYLVAGLAGYGG